MKKSPALAVAPVLMASPLHAFADTIPHVATLIYGFGGGLVGGFLGAWFACWLCMRKHRNGKSAGAA